MLQIYTYLTHLYLSRSHSHGFAAAKHAYFFLLQPSLPLVPELTSLRYLLSFPPHLLTNPQTLFHDGGPPPR